ncbi:MAG: adenosylcobinamide-GDP ribazoletransferase, partial [Candidatus Omnitrophota bacterium]
MKSFLAALQFLTIIPIKIKNIEGNHLSRSLIYFPAVGLILGLILLGINKLLLFLNFAEFSLSIILVVSLIILTGGIHLDGLSDTFDALLSRKNKEEMLKIMRDSHVGVMGTLSIISVLLLKISFLYSIGISLKPISLILMCLLSKWGMVFSMYLFPYAREEGKAKVFIAGINLKIFILSSLIMLIPTFFIWNL